MRHGPWLMPFIDKLSIGCILKGYMGARQIFAELSKHLRVLYKGKVKEVRRSVYYGRMEIGNGRLSALTTAERTAGIFPVFKKE